jgi:hypothetical protein
MILEWILGLSLAAFLLAIFVSIRKENRELDRQIDAARKRIDAVLAAFDAKK